MTEHVAVMVSPIAAFNELCEPVGQDSVISHTFTYNTVVAHIHTGTVVLECYKDDDANRWWLSILNFYCAIEKLHCEPKNTHQNVLVYSLQNLTNGDKICDIFSWVNLSYRDVNGLRLAWIIVSTLPSETYYLRFGREQQLELWTENTPKCFVIHFTKQSRCWWTLAHIFLIKFTVT